MRRWDPLNETQLQLLRRIADGDDLSGTDGVRHRTSARALQSRGLVDVSRRSGNWRAVVTEAGTFYLKNGHHPDRPTAETRPGGGETAVMVASGDEQKLAARGRPRTSAAALPPIAASAQDLIQKLQAAGGTVRFESPDDSTRARYRRVIHACKQYGLVPDGSELVYTGRDRGDLVVQLSLGQEVDKTDWNRVRLSVRRVTTDPSVLATVLEEHPAILNVTDAARPRAIRLVRALADQLQRAGMRLGVNAKPKTPKLFIQADKARRAVTVHEQHDKIRHRVTDEERRALRSMSWTPPPEFDTVASGRLTLKVARAGWDNVDSWSDEKGDRLEKRLSHIVSEIRSGVVADEEAQRRAEVEAAERQAKLKREEEDKRVRWQKAVSEARIRASETLRRDRFSQAISAWVAAGEVRAFCDALESAGGAFNAEQQENLARWLSWARSRADLTDPTLGSPTFADVAFDVTPEPDDLRPFIGDWSPHRPERDYGYGARKTPSTPKDAGGSRWHPGLRGKPTWWRQ